MASYLLQVGYAPEAWAAMIQNPAMNKAATCGYKPVAATAGR